tara:strand:+ start:1566 stop:1931 length:366 start_codon:yes stop_codon:yes gene_type:complete
MKDLLRDSLELQILEDGKNGDTTVLAELLSNIGDRVIFNCLGDEKQLELQEKYPHLRYYYEVHINGNNGFSTCVISSDELDDDEVILLGYEQDKLEGDDCHHIDYVQELGYEDWDLHFNIK